MKLVLTLGPHPNAPLELYMNRGDRLDDRQWHTVEVIRSLKVGKTFKLCFFLTVNISDPLYTIDHMTTFGNFFRDLPDFLRAHSLADILRFLRFFVAFFVVSPDVNDTRKCVEKNIIHQKLHETPTD